MEIALYHKKERLYIIIDERGMYQSHYFYINSVLNGLLALNKYSEKLNEGSCECNLCKFLLSTELNAISLRIWASELNPIFAMPGRQEDASEFLRVLINKLKSIFARSAER